MFFPGHWARQNPDIWPSFFIVNFLLRLKSLASFFNNAEFTIQDTLSGVFSDVTTTYLNRPAVPPRIVDISDPRIVDTTDPRIVDITDPRIVDTTDPRTVDITDPSYPRIVDTTDPHPRIDDATDPRLVEITDPRTFETTDPILNDASNTDP